MKTEKSRFSTEPVEFQQHWIVWLMFSRPNIIRLTNSHIIIEKRRYIQRIPFMKTKIFNKKISHPNSTSSVSDEFQSSIFWTWLITAPIALLALFVGKFLPIIYGTIVVTSDAGGVDRVRFVVNHKKVVDAFESIKQ